MAEKLSQTQRNLLGKLDEHGRLVRYPGGFWSAPGVYIHRSSGIDVPEWHYSTKSVQALLERGVLKSFEERGNSQGLFSVAVVRNNDLKAGGRVRFTHERPSLSIYYHQFLGREGILVEPRSNGEWVVEFSQPDIEVKDHLFLYPAQIEVVNE